MNSIDQHIQQDEDLLNNPTTSPQARRHVEEELEALKNYKENHPNDTHDPSSLELYCNSNPGALECRVYDN
jgi:hypothetical protein